MTGAFDLRERRLEPEIMDDPSLAPAHHTHALAGLARINRWSFSHRILWRPIRELARELERPIRVLDVGTGSADVPLALARAAGSAGLAISFDGCDRSPHALAVAHERAADAGVHLGLFQLDACSEPLPDGYDVIMCSLFLHHLIDDEAAALLRSMSRAATQLVLACDLVRCLPGLMLTWLGTRILTRSHVVHTDGILSLRASYTPDELKRIARAAGLEDAVIKRHWPLRQLLTWRRP